MGINISNSSRIKTNIIAISGFVACGKNTISKLVAEKLKFRVVDPTFKSLAEREGISLMQFQERANSDFNIDKKFDEDLRDECNRGNCVIATWLGPWMSPKHSFKVWLDADINIRAKRILSRDNFSSLVQATHHIKKRDEDNILRYKKIYNIDITDHRDFNLIIDTNNKSPDEIASIIISEFKSFIKI